MLVDFFERDAALLIVQDVLNENPAGRSDAQMV